MDKHTRNYIISITAFTVFAAAALLAGPENPGLRLVLTACAVATVPFSLVNAWKSAPARRARREAAAAAGE
jgi:hypothetical protein